MIDRNINSQVNLDDAAACIKLQEWAERQGYEAFRISEFESCRGDESETTAFCKSMDYGEQTGNPKPMAKSSPRCYKEIDVEFGVNLVGYATGELGIGEDVRMMVKSLETTDIPFCVVNRKPVAQIRQADTSITQYITETPKYPITIVCMTGFDTAQLWLERPDLFEGKFVIGYWPWELPEWPAEWVPVYELIDEVWASSHYTENAYKHTSPKPVRYMPMAVVMDGNASYTRKDFGFSEDTFTFLFVFDFMSFPERKNPFACVNAFSKAFPHGQESVRLILKVSNVDESDPRWDKIVSLARKDSRIEVIKGTMDRSKVVGLMAACDAYLSLHRAEGFGRTMAEAMLLRKPVIATGYSGNLDFLTEETGYPVQFSLIPVGKGEYPFAEGFKWAEPSTDSAAKHMVSVFNDRAKVLEKADRAYRLIRYRHGAKNVGNRCKKRLLDIFYRKDVSQV
jgi:glycosyltransferase involved in cell wall biosynthesis